MIPAAEYFGLGLLPFFPLAKGLLTGKVTRDKGIPGGTRLAATPAYVTDGELDRVEALRDWADKHGRTLLEVAIGALPRDPPSRP